MSTPLDDNDRTVIRPAAPVSTALPVGTGLGEFVVVRVIGEGGFGIVYEAIDRTLQRHVAVKEFMPAALAARNADGQVSVRSARHRETFDTALRSFVNEARLLAHFDHPALVKVHRFWEANGTAYMVMPLYEGVTLKHVLKDLPERPSEEWLKSILEPLIDALELMHAKQCFHRDIAPDNLLILHDGRPVLLDFGAARRVIGDMTQALTVILKPGFAPVEQYAEVPEMKQGPWTDVYALAALIYYAIGGRAPTPSVARIMNDTLIPAEELGKGRYSVEFLRAIDAALVVHPDRRTQSMTQLRVELGIAALERGRTVLEASPKLSSAALPSASPSASPTGSPFASPTASPNAGATAGSNSRPDSSRLPAPVSARRVSYGWLMIPGLLMILALAGGIGWYLHYSGSQTPKSASAGSKLAVSATTPPLTPAPSGVGKNGTVTERPATERPASERPTTERSTTERPATDPAAIPVISGGGKAPFSPSAVSELLYQSRATDWSLTGQASPQTVEIDRDFIRFAIRSERAGFLYIFMLGSDTRDWWMIFPNGKDRNNKLVAGEPLSLPRKTWPIQSGGPPGTTRFLAIASETERDFGAGGLKLTRDFGKFDLAAAALAYEQSADPGILFAGEPRCPTAAAECNKSYGAVQFQIEEISRRVIPKKPASNSSD
jgi:serine/threonine protein kinase